MKLSEVRSAIEAQGLSWRGALHVGARDVPGHAGIGTIVLAGFVGGGSWQHFAMSPEARDGAPDPLDRWSLRIVGALARDFGAFALFPFLGPPWLPFLRWAQQAEPLHSSPIGMLIHPEWGLWHSFRGALGFREHFELPPPDGRPSPCDACAEKPCLSACPVGAFEPDRYDVAGCVAHLRDRLGADCMTDGCRARRACPVGAEFRYMPEQASFSMRAFRAAQGDCPRKAAQGVAQGLEDQANREEQLGLERPLRQVMR